MTSCEAVRIRKKATVAIVPDESATSAPAEADFGANDWLLERRCTSSTTADPSSVDRDLGGVLQGAQAHQAT